jgi:hypothetical protein
MRLAQWLVPNSGKPEFGARPGGVLHCAFQWDEKSVPFVPPG